MLIGDNLADFNNDFEEKLSEERTNYTDDQRNEFGTKHYYQTQTMVIGV